MEKPLSIFIVADGKHCSPSARKVSQLRELTSAENDTHILRKVVISILWVKNKHKLLPFDSLFLGSVLLKCHLGLCLVYMPLQLF